MKRNLPLLLALAFPLSLPAAAPAPGHPDSRQWRPLFAADLSDAIYPAGVWTARNGEFTASKDECLWTRGQYENFIVDLEFKNGDAANMKQ